VGQRPDAGQKLPAYDVADIRAQWDINPAWRLFARIENLGDVHYQTAFGYDQPRRGAFIGLRWRGEL
jgi:vitamin B12 transporter